MTAVSPRALATGLALAALALGASACKEVEEESSEGYVPATVKEAKGDAAPVVTFTAEGARRTGLRTARAGRAGGETVVPYTSLLYDAEGHTFVYTNPRALTYVRAEVSVDRIDGRRAFLRRGPSPGTPVVTTGTTEVHGAELDIAGSH